MQFELLEKQAYGNLRFIANKLKSPISNTMEVFHGTGNKSGINILKEGLKPDIGGGVSDVVNPDLKKIQAGMSFITTHPAIAQTYGRQQAIIDAEKRTPGIMSRLARAKTNQATQKFFNNKIVKTLEKHPKINSILKTLKDASKIGAEADPFATLQKIMPQLKINPDKYKILKANIPKKEYHEMFAGNPEKELKKREAEFVAGKGTLASKIIYAPSYLGLAQQYGLKGAVKPSYISEYKGA